jgi:hypothetical protein
MLTISASNSAKGRTRPPMHGYTGVTVDAVHQKLSSYARRGEHEAEASVMLSMRSATRLPGRAGRAAATARPAVGPSTDRVRVQQAVLAESGAINV